MSGNSIEVKEIHIEFNDEVKEILEEIARKCADDIKNRAPKRHGVYADGWTFKREGEHYIVFNDGEEKSLSHLIEKGHSTRWGKWVQANPHILPSYNIHSAELKDKLNEMLKNKLKEIK